MISSNDAVDRGREAWDRVKANAKMLWQDWLIVGEALKIGRNEAMVQSGIRPSEVRSDKRLGRAYNVAFSDWLRANGFGDMDKGARARLLDLMDNLASVDEWRASLRLRDNTLDPNPELQFNHPNTVWRQWQAWKKRHAVPQDDPTSPEEKPPTLSAKKDAEILRLQEELDAAQRKLRLAQYSDIDWTIQDEEVLAAKLVVLAEASERPGTLLRVFQKAADRLRHGQPPAPKKRGKRQAETPPVEPQPQPKPERPQLRRPGTEP